jgi:hypothetical protein
MGADLAWRVQAALGGPDDLAWQLRSTAVLILDQPVSIGGQSDIRYLIATKGDLLQPNLP